MQTCPKCQQPVNDGQRFCPNCGASLVAGDQLPQQGYPQAPYSQPVPPQQGYPQAPYSQPVPPQQGYPQAPYSQPMSPYSQPYTQPQPQQPFTPRTIAPNLLGQSADPNLVQSTNFVQRVLLSNAKQFSTDPIAGAILGAIVTLVSGLVLTFALFAIISSFTAHDNTSQAATQIFTSNILIVFLLEHGASLTASGSFLGASANASVSLPLTMLLAIPAISSVIGGFVAASTDYSNDVRFAIGRGASMGPVYGILLAIVGALFGNIDIVIGKISESFFSVLIYGVLWGTVFGMVGGLVKVYGFTWRSDIAARILRKQRKPMLAGLIGGSMTIGLGLLLSLPLVLFVISIGLIPQQIQSNLASTTYGISSGVILIFIFIASPMIAIWLLGFASGGSLTISTIGISSLSSIPSQGAQNNSLSLFFNNDPIHQAGGAAYAIYLLILIPIIASYFGGRVAARVTGTSDRSAMIQSGAFAGITSAIIMAILATMTSISASGSSGFLGINTTASGNTSIGVGVGDSFIGMLVFGLVFSTLAASRYQPPKQTTQRPARHNPFFNLFDSLATQPRDLPRSAPRTLLYNAMAMALIGAVVLIVLMIISPVLIGSIDLTALIGLNSLIAGLMLGIPALLLVLALATDMVSVSPASIAKQPPVEQTTPAFPFNQPDITLQQTTQGDLMPPSNPMPPIQG